MLTVSIILTHINHYDQLNFNVYQFIKQSYLIQSNPYYKCILILEDNAMDVRYGRPFP